MNIIQALLLSIVEGISEFLPISSTAHLILTSELLKISQTNFVKSFEIFIQLGAILAVVVLYLRKVLASTIIWKKVLAGFIPTAIIGFILYKFIKQVLLGNPYIALAALFLGGVILIMLEKMYKEKKHHIDSIENLSYKNAAIIGTCQALAVIPGISRSAATIIGALFLGTKRQTAVEYSFLLAVPTMLAATVFDLKESAFSFTSFEFILLGIGFVGAFFTAIAAIKFFLKYIKYHTFIPFGIYRIVLSIFYFIFFIY